MGDQQQRHAEFLLQVLEKLEDLRLHRDVERRRRLIGDEQVGIVGERHGDHHPLALAAGQLMRIAFERRSRSRMPTLVRSSMMRARCAVAAQRRMQLEDFADLPLDRVQRVERGHRLLEDHGDVIAAHLAQVPLVGIEQFLALEPDASRGMTCGGIGQELQDRQRRHRFARARFADQRQRLALVEREGNVVDRECPLLALPEGDREISTSSRRGSLMRRSFADRRHRAPLRRRTRAATA